MLELKIVDFILFYISDLRLGISVISHDTVTVTSHTITYHNEIS